MYGVVASVARTAPPVPHRRYRKREGSQITVKSRHIFKRLIYFSRKHVGFLRYLTTALVGSFSVLDAYLKCQKELCDSGRGMNGPIRTRPDSGADTGFPPQSIKKKGALIPR